MNDIDTTPKGTDDARREAAQRLAMVGMLQMHQIRRSQRPGRGAPWQDPRQGQGRVLALLKLQPETTQKELTYLLGMSRQSLAELLAKLERQGLVEREPAADDKRVVVVRLTEAGAGAEQADERQASPANDLLDALDDDEVSRLSGYLARILERIDREWPEDDPRRARGFGRGGFPRFGGPGAGDGPRDPWAPREHGPHEHGPHEHGPHEHGHRGPHRPRRGPADGTEREE
jgi:DNA-binding MarR family transcriptional regulator